MGAYRTPGNAKTLHQEALLALADCGRMMSLKFLKWECMKHCPEGHFRAGHYADRMWRNIKIFLYRTVLETVIFMQIQATFVGLARCLDKSHAVVLELVTSVIVSILSTLIGFVDTSQLVYEQYLATKNATCQDELGGRVYATLKMQAFSR